FRRCNHINVVKMYENFIFYDNDTLYNAIVLESGINNIISAQFKGGIVLSYEDRRNILYQIVCGLQHSLNKGIMNADIKPLNIILFKNNRAAISDFGLSQFNMCTNKPHEYRGSIVYTDDFRAPEIFL